MLPLIDSNNLITLPHMAQNLANRILTISDSQIKATLFDILELKYINATIERLHQIQNAIRNSYNKDSHFLLNSNDWSSDTITEELNFPHYSYLKAFKDYIKK